MTLRRALAVGALLAVVGIATTHRSSLWRAAYPYLPRQVQGLPYMARQRLHSARPAPVPLPTARAMPVLAPAATATTRPTTAPATATAVPTVRLPAAFHLGPGVHEYQTWNNCGPATVSMAIGRLGQAPGQAAAARELKPDPDDKNVSPDELAAYARRHGYGSLVRVDGTVVILRRLLSMGLPVIVETWFIPEPGDEMGHYRVLTGYDDATGRFEADDSYNGPGVELPYGEFDRLWRVFDRTYVPVYPLGREADVRTALGEELDDRSMFVGAVATAQREIVAGADAFGYFNLGSALLGLGDAQGAASAYDAARRIGLPWRMLWYQFGPFAAYAQVGRWDDVADLARANLHNAPNLEESHFWLGRALLARGDRQMATEEWNTALSLNPNFGPALEALEALDAAARQ